MAYKKGTDFRKLLVAHRDTQPINKGTYKVIVWYNNIERNCVYNGIKTDDVKIYADNDVDALIKWLDYVNSQKNDFYDVEYDKFINADDVLLWALADYFDNNGEEFMTIQRYKEIVIGKAPESYPVFPTCSI